MRFAEGQEKRILREILARYVPRQIWDAPKHGFDFPFQAFLAADNYALARMYIESDASPLVELFKPDFMRSYLKRFIAGDTSLAFKIWTFVVLAIWLDGHKSCFRH
jgi:asparagine synthase (glutamine-hydrolysing)